MCNLTISQMTCNSQDGVIDNLLSGVFTLKFTVEVLDIPRHTAVCCVFIRVTS
jgi:hypothetical protein